MARDPFTNEEIICPPDDITEEGAGRGQRSQRRPTRRPPGLAPDRARLAGKTRTFVNPNNYKVMTRAYFSGEQQDLTPYQQEKVTSQFYGSPWVDFSQANPLNEDRFRFVLNNFWVRVNEERFVYAQDLNPESSVQISNVEYFPATQEELQANFDAVYDLDTEVAQRVMLTVEPSDFSLFDDEARKFRDFLGLTADTEFERMFRRDFIFTDQTFEMSVPFSERELRKLGTINRPSIEKHSSEYTFFSEAYENSIIDQRENLYFFPNLYVFLAEKNSSNRSGFFNDQGEWQHEGGSIYDRLIRLNGSIDNVFMDVLNERGEKIGEKDEGRYFEKWARALDPGPPSNLEQYKNIIFSPFEMDFFSAYNEKRHLFPMYVDMEFTTDIETQVAEAVKQAELGTSILRGWLERGSFDDQGVFIQRPLPWFRAANFVSNTEQILQTTDDRGEEELTTTSTVDTTNTTPEFNFLEWWSLYSQPGEEGGNDLYEGDQYVTIQTNRKELFELGGEDAGGTVEFARLINSLILSGRLTQIAKEKTRSFEEIMAGKPAHSETMFYKIAKYRLRPDGTPNLQAPPLQQIFIPNSNELDVLRYIDTQVSYEDKIHYRITAMQMVFGTDYVYLGEESRSDNSERFAVNILTKPRISMVEVPYFEFDSRITDSPPMVPDINIVPFKNVDDQILINFAANAGEITVQPIALTTQEEEMIAELRQSQGVEDGKPVTFSGDDEIDFYEVYRMTSKPKTWLEVGDNFYTTVDSEDYGAKRIRASATSLIDIVSPNIKYYYVFRAVDIHGNTSNPSSIYQSELINTDGAIYHLLEVVDFDQPEQPPKSKEFGRFINIAPVLEQQEIVVANQDEIDSAFAAIVSLGTTEDNLFVPRASKARKYKFRITSKQSGKKVDLNVTFKHEHISQTDAE